jgi:CO/xanthine dehydrogenase FAD-binding subunit
MHAELGATPARCAKTDGYNYREAKSMISAYHRPTKLAEALTLVARASPPTLPLAGGTQLSRSTRGAVEVVDLQGLGLNEILIRGDHLEIGAMTTLEQLHRSTAVPPALQQAAALEVPLNLRNAATVAGTVVCADGKSTVTGVLLALDATLMVATAPSRSAGAGAPSTSGARGNPRTSTAGERRVGLGDFLPLRESISGSLITRLTVPQNPRVEFEYVARTPKSPPIVFVVVATWPSGRVRAVCGGFGDAPLLALDGVGAMGLIPALRNALHDADDYRGSAEYRMAAATVLTQRCADRLGLALRGQETQV